MTGWKTKLAAVIVAASAVLQALGLTEWSGIVLTVGGALGLVGVGHKIDKANPNAPPKPPKAA